MLSVKNLGIALGNFSLRNISFEVREGEYVAILGMSGAGKTILLEMLCGLLKSREGTIVLDGQDITALNIRKRPVRLVYQDQALFPHLSVRENLEFSLRCRKAKPSLIARRVKKTAEEVGVVHLLDRMPATLSGGEAQRTALGRALADNPRLLLLDEPLSSLDPGSSDNIRALLRNLNRQGLTIIHVTHNYEEAMSLAKNALVIENSTIVQSGSPEQIFSRPKTPFVARFAGIKNFIKGRLVPADDSPDETACFVRNGLEISIAGVEPGVGGPGYFMPTDEGIELFSSPNGFPNVFSGTIADMVPNRSGVELIVDIGFKVSVSIGKKAIRSLKPEHDKKIFVRFKPEDGRFMEE